MKGYALKKWESTLNFVFMHMDPMWNLSWKLLVIIITSRVNRAFARIDFPMKIQILVP